MRAVALGLVVATATPVATASAATRVTASRPRIEVTVDPGDRFSGFTGSGAPALFGETGDDQLHLGPVASGGLLDGGPGNDTLEDVSDGDRTGLSGGPGNDIIKDTAGRDQIDGGSGDDLIAALDGRGDHVMGGEGNDTGEGSRLHRRDVRVRDRPAHEPRCTITA